MAKNGGGEFVGGLLLGGVGAAIVLGAISSSKESPPPKSVIDQIRENILRDQIDPEIRALALSIVRDIPPNQRLRRVEALYHWVTERLAWKPDAASVDRAAPIWETLRLGGGDCDCLTTALCTLIEAAGHATWLMLTPGHVLSVVPVSKAWVERNGDRMVLLTGEEQYWLAFDPSLTPAKPGTLGGETLAHVARGEARVVVVGNTDPRQLESRAASAVLDRPLLPR